MNAVVLVPGALVVAGGGPEESPPGLADPPGYRAALEDRPGPEGPVAAVGFRDLWDHSQRYRGRRVRVDGRIVRQFRQAPVGLFPALTEAWMVSPAGDPFCLVFPTAGPGAEP